MATQHKRVHQLPKQIDSTLTNLKHLQKTFFSPPRIKKEHVNDIKEQLYFNNQRKSNYKCINLSGPTSTNKRTVK